MKKLISLGLTLAMLLSAGSAFAEDDYSQIEDAFDFTDIENAIDYSTFGDYSEYAPTTETVPEVIITNEPTLLYNNAVIGAEGSKPYITDGRTMLPFRYLLEQIGATVNYDEATRTVTTEKNDISIAFSLDDVYLDITKNGQTERVMQDVKNEIKDDRVYVPIRFMAEAFDLNVGWDSEAQTAIIIDIPQYIADLCEKVPNLEKIIELSSKASDNYTQTLDMTFDFEIVSPEQNANFNLVLDSEVSLNVDKAVADALFDVDTNILKDFADINVEKLEDVQFTFMYADGVFYAKTNLVDKLAEIAPNHEKLANIKTLVTADTWFKADLVELFELVGLPTDLIETLKTMLRGNVSEEQLYDVLAKAFEEMEITSIYDAESINMIFTLYEKMFSAFEITDAANGGVELKFEMTKEFLFDLIFNTLTGERIPEDDPEFQAIMDAITFNLTANGLYAPDSSITEDTAFSLGFDLQGSRLNMDMKMNSKLTPNTNKEITPPEAAFNLIDIIKLYM